MEHIIDINIEKRKKSYRLSNNKQLVKELRVKRETDAKVCFRSRSFVIIVMIIMSG